MLKDLFKEESGTNAVEYGLLMALIVVVLIGAIRIFGNTVNTSFFAVAAKIFP